MQPRYPAKITHFGERHTADMRNLTAFFIGEKFTKNGKTTIVGGSAPKTPVVRQTILKTLQTEPNAMPPGLKNNIAEDRKNIVISYDPNVFSNYELLEKTLYTAAQAENGDPTQGEGEAPANQWRYLTKHRTITSQVTCYGNGYDDSVDSFKLVLTTACAPNLMGTSPNDLNEFVKNDKLDEKKYKATMKLLFKRLLAEQDNFSVHTVIMPVLGGDIYLKQASDKKKALALIHLALKETLEKAQFRNIQRVVYTIPEDLSQDRETMYADAANVLRDYNQKQPTNNNAPELCLINSDVFATAKHFTDQGLRVGLINPGSDRTIGGQYQELAPALEEQICTLTDAAWVQARDLNPQLGIQNYRPFPQYLQQTSIQSPAQSSTGHVLNHISRTSGEHTEATPTTHPSDPTSVPVPAEEVSPLPVATLEAQPPTTQTLPSFLADENIVKIQQVLPKNNTAGATGTWSITANPGFSIVRDEKQIERFRIYPTQMTTNDISATAVETYKAMLTSFKAIHSNTPPKITTKAECKADWLTAYQAVYQTGGTPMITIRGEIPTTTPPKNPTRPAAT